MKGGLRHKGFTIVETMIVLAVTGALFVMAAALISGRQNRAEFTQSINDIKSRIQQSLNQVTAGYFPSNANFTCSVVGAEPNLSNVGSNAQGTNSDCIFMGKAFQFGVQATNPEQFSTYTLAGLRQNSAGANVANLGEAMVTPVYPFGNNQPDLTERVNLQYGLTTLTPNGMYYNDGANHSIGAFALVPALAKSNDIGSQQVDLVAISGTNLQQTETVAASAIKSSLRTAGNYVVNPSGGVGICFVSGTTNQSGLITIGSNGRELTVTLSIKGNITCS